VVFRFGTAEHVPVIDKDGTEPAIALLPKDRLPVVGMFRSGRQL
jgi:hypothetical protein